MYNTGTLYYCVRGCSSCQCCSKGEKWLDVQTTTTKKIILHQNDIKATEVGLRTAICDVLLKGIIPDVDRKCANQSTAGEASLP